MKIKTVKATKRGWLVNNKIEIGFDYEKEEFSKDLDEWFKENKAEPLYTPKEKRKNNRYRRLSSIFAEKVVGVKAIAIDEDWTTDERFINAQLETYETMRKNADKGVYDKETNEVIIEKNNEANALVAELTLLINSIKTVIRKEIESDSNQADKMLHLAENFSLKKDEISKDKLTEIKKLFGV
jgi:hypothetical protein